MSAKNEYVDEKYETESYQSTGDNAVNRSSVLSMKTLRNSYIIFPFVVVVCIIIYASMEKSSQTSTDVNIASATASSDKLEGTYFLFDLSTEQGALENDNVYESPDYADAVATMTSNVNTWLTRVGDADIPTTEGERDTWATNGGVSPWIPDTALARDVPQKYSYAAAPHILFLLVDDWGYNDVGYQSNYLSWATPNIDKIASNGIKLTNYYTNNLCTPSRASLMTGRYALRFGMHGTPDDAELPISEATLAEELKSAGYRTNLVGKWHLGWSSEEKTPNKRGFDYFYGYLGGHIDYWTKLFMGTNLDLNDNGRIVTTEWELDQSLHSAYLFQSKVESVIEDHATNHAQDPMFLYYASQLVHSDWAAPQKYIDRCSAADLTAVEIPDLTYCGMNLMLDEVVGNLTCALDKYGMADNTVLIIASDNGGYAAMAGTNYPYRGSKGSLTRGGESVAALIHAPMSLMPDAAKGSSYDGQMHVTDWLPTLMGLATGGAWTGSLVDNTIDGWDMWNAVTTNTPSPRREIVNYLTSDGEVSYILDGKKLIVSESSLDAVTPPSFEFQGTQLAADVCIV